VSEEAHKIAQSAPIWSIGPLPVPGNRIAPGAMLPLSVTTSIDVPRERVFAFLSELANRPAFTDRFIDGYHLERIPSSGVGAAARFRVGPATARVWMETVIEELEPPHLIKERGRAGRLDRIPVFTAWELLAGAGSTTELTLTFWTEPSHPLDRLRERLGARRWYRRHWSRALRRLKQLLEADTPIEPTRIAGEDRVPTLPSAVRH
jgi:uncharacterized protein YndB with AHSA1/START domain